MKLCTACAQDLAEPAGWTCPACGYQPPAQDDILLFSQTLAAGGSGFDAALFPQLAALEAGHFWYRARNRLIQWTLQTYFPQAQSLLEVGCGTGFVLAGLRNAFPHLALAGSEIFPQGLRFAAERLPGVSLWQMDARRLPFRDEFDVIGAFDVLEHIEEDEAVLAQLRQAVRSDQGGVLLTVPQHPGLWSVHDDRAHHVRRYEAAELRRKVEAAGFEILRMTSFVALLLPPMMVSRLLPSPAANDLDQSHEFQIHPLLNRAFEQVMNAELALIRRGVNFHAGGSLLVAARVRR